MKQVFILLLLISLAIPAFAGEKEETLFSNGFSLFSGDVDLGGYGGPLQPAGDGVPGTARDPGDGRLAQSLHAQGRYQIKGGAGAVEAVVDRTGVGAEGHTADGAAIAAAPASPGPLEGMTHDVSLADLAMMRAMGVRAGSGSSDGSSHSATISATLHNHHRGLSRPNPFAGVLAPAAALRPEIVPRNGTAAAAAERPQPARAGEPDPPATRPRNYSWAELMKRVFAIDVLECPCGGRRSVIAVITQPPIIRAILDCLGLSSAGSARSPPGTRTIPGSLDEPKNEPDTPEPRFVPDPG